MATRITDQGKQNIKKEDRKFSKNDTKSKEKFKKCSLEDRERTLNYLSYSKGVIPYEMITRFDSLDIAPPEDAKLFLPHHFHSSLKSTTISR